jgi:hypothetical protein
MIYEVVCGTYVMRGLIAETWSTLTFRFGAAVAYVWIFVVLITHTASADSIGGETERIEGRRLESFLLDNHFQAVAREGKGFSVEAESGIVTVELSNDSGKCTSDGGVIKKSVAVDVRTLRTDSERVAEFEEMTLVLFPFLSDTMETLRLAYDAQEGLIAEARAEHGWGLAAAIAASEEFTQQYGEALALYREDFVDCSGGHTVQISDPLEWTVALQPSADPFEFVDLLRRYQASLSRE